MSQSVQGLLTSAARAAWREGWHWPRVVLVVLLSAWLVGARWGAGRPVRQRPLQGCAEWVQE